MNITIIEVKTTEFARRREQLAQRGVLGQEGQGTLLAVSSGRHQAW